MWRLALKEEGHGIRSVGGLGVGRDPRDQGERGKTDGRIDYFPLSRRIFEWADACQRIIAPDMMPAARALTTHLALRLRPLCAVVDTAVQTRWAGPTLATYRRGRQPQQLRKRARWLLRRVLRPFKNQSSVRGRAFRSFGSLSDDPSGRSSCVPAACQAQLTAPPPPFRTRCLLFIYCMHNARLNPVRSPPLSMNSRASSRVVPQARRGATICPRQSRRQAIEDALRQHVGAGLKWEAMATFILSLSFCPPVMDDIFSRYA